jgi:polysaccharide export outer membrane protein
MTLLDALNKAGRMERADLSCVTLRRNGRDYILDLSSFVEKGDARHNPILMPGDIVIVEPPANGTVYTFGEVGVGELTLGIEETSLTSVLAKRGGIDKLRANARGVFVFRARKPNPAATSPVSPGITVYQFELDQPAMLVLAQTFEMRGGDVVFVTQEPISRWNDMIGKLLSPVVTTLRAQAVVTALDGE